MLLVRLWRSCAARTHARTRAASACSERTSVISMDDSHSWRKAVEKHFGLSFGKKWAQLKVDMLCLTHGLKPSLLVDYLPQDLHRLQQFLEDIDLPRCCRNAHTGDLCIVDVEQNILITTLSHLKRLTESLKSTASPDTSTGTMYVDITQHLPSPRVVSPETSVLVRHQLLTWCRAVSCKLKLVTTDSERAREHHIPAIEAPPLPGPQSPPNLCSLFGQLLGYPTVYWFDTEKDYSLSMVDLVHHSLTVQPQQSPSNHGCCLGGRLSQASLWQAGNIRLQYRSLSCATPFS